MGVGSAGALLQTLRELVAGGLALDQALPAFTANPAALLRLRGKGSIAMGADADLVQLDATGNAQTVIIRGQVHVRDGVAIRRGTFET
jgi:beta-aspartyl-dipeptidase (metallo-type)